MSCKPPTLFPFFESTAARRRQSTTPGPPGPCTLTLAYKRTPQKRPPRYEPRECGHDGMYSCGRYTRISARSRFLGLKETDARSRRPCFSGPDVVLCRWRGGSALFRFHHRIGSEFFCLRLTARSYINAEAEAGSRLACRLPRSRHASCGHCLSRLVCARHGSELTG